MLDLIECGDPLHAHSGPCTTHPTRPVCGDSAHRHNGPCEVYALDPRPRLTVRCGCGLVHGTARGVTVLPDRCPACRVDWSTLSSAAPTPEEKP